jgi:ketosteroid isomerase-like protein
MQSDTLPWAVLACVDQMDTDGFLEFLDDSVNFRFGNAEPVVGKQSLKLVLDGFFSALGGIAHQVEQVWQVEDDIVCHGRVTYTRHDASELTVPFANVFQLDSGRIRDYLIFVDNSRLFE